MDVDIGAQVDNATVCWLQEGMAIVPSVNESSLQRVRVESSHATIMSKRGAKMLTAPESHREVERLVLVLDGEMSRQRRQQARRLRQTVKLFDGISDGISDFQKPQTVHPCGFAQNIQVHLSQEHVLSNPKMYRNPLLAPC
jgi:hypothetical protein